MDSDSTSIKIDQLKESNYHAWKIRIQHVLILKGLKDLIVNDPPTDTTALQAWTQKDQKTQAVIGLSLSDEMLENVREHSTAKDMWNSITNVFERHTLLNKLAARRKFYTAVKNETESILKFSNRIRQLSSSLKSMNVIISESEMAMALLNGLPDEYRALISGLDTIDSNESELSWEHVKARVLQEEQRIEARHQMAQAKSETAALLSSQKACANCSTCNGRPQRSRPYCNHCKRHGHVEAKCFIKHPHLNPKRKRLHKTALIAEQSDEDDAVCLMAKYEESGEPRNSGNWFVDSACSIHMTYDISLFSSYSPGYYPPVRMGNSNTASVAGKGVIDLEIYVNGLKTKCKLLNVLHVPKLGYQLLSVSSMDKLGLKTSFHSSRCFIETETSIIATGTMVGNLYRLDTSHPDSALVAATIETWHQRLGHLHPSAIRSMASKRTAKGLDLEGTEGLMQNCQGCILRKSHRSAIPKASTSKSSRLLELVHSDVNGPMETPSLGGSKYFVTFIDDFSKWIVMYTMRRKSDTFKCFKKYHAFAEKHTGSKISLFNVIKCSMKSKEEIKALRTDNGGEYLSNEFKTYLETHGIHHQLTVAYTPQQNGVAERMNRTLMDCVRSMIFGANLDMVFWAEALSTAVYIRNRVVSQSLPDDVTPYHRWIGETPDLSNLRIFGSKCWYVIPKERKKKLDARAHEGILLGYSSQSKGYKIWNKSAKRIIVSRDVRFNEAFGRPFQFEIEISDKTAHNGSVPGGQVKKEVELNIMSPDEPLVDKDDDPAYSGNDSRDNAFEDAADSPKPALRRSSRIRKPPGEWRKHNALLAYALSAQVVPSSYKAATSPDNISFWQSGIESEHSSLLRCKTWKLVDYEPSMKILPSMYVFKVKDNKPKVRLVALGNRQTFGIDYHETFAPVVTMTTIRSVLAVAATNDLELEQMDVKTAFLNGDLNENVFMSVPEGLRSTSNVNKVCKLQKSIYGLKQSPRQWYAKMHEFLLRLGFISSQNDPCLYVRHLTNSILMIALYVDDLLIAGSSITEVKTLKSKLSSRFEMKDMGAARVMLGLMITRDRATRRVFISQSEYARTVLERFGMEKSKPVATPMDKSYSIHEGTDSDPINTTQYRQAIGSLMYLMIGSRPDLAYSIGKLSQHCENPSETNWIAVKRLLRYVKATSDFGILYQRKNNFRLEGFSDADWAGCHATRKSTSGVIFLLAGGAISWKSKRQTCVSTSTCEAEYIALCLATKEAIWLARLISDICDYKIPQVVSIGVDNQGTIDTGENSSINQRNKHIDVQYHFVRDAVQEI